MGLFDREQDRSNEQAEAGKKAEAQAITAHQEGVTMETKKSEAPSESRKPASAARRDEGLSVIGRTLHVKGELEAAEDMLIEGRVEGSIKHTANRLTVGTSGVVNADINAKNLVIEGTVEGNVVGSESVEIRSSADVRGNVYTARISIADGAQFSGTVDMDMSRSPKH
jgi:cytoskeletal protein CcmA (bactofilin family)